jgi:hypothetical protein
VIVKVFHVETDGSTIAQAMATVGRTKRKLEFAGEPRMLAEIGAEIERTGRPVKVEIEAWQILG